MESEMHLVFSFPHGIGKCLWHQEIIEKYCLVCQVAEKFRGWRQNWGTCVTSNISLIHFLIIFGPNNLFWPKLFLNFFVFDQIFVFSKIFFRGFSFAKNIFFNTTFVASKIFVVCFPPHFFARQLFPTQKEIHLSEI